MYDVVAAADPHANPCVFVHGFEGAFLARRDNGKRAWLTFQQAIGRGDRTPSPLRLPLLSTPDATGDPGPLVADGLHDAARCCGRVLKEVYGPVARALGTDPSRAGRPFRLFVYDWRLDLTETNAKLEAFLRQVSWEAGGKRVQVVCHSMGGMLTYPILKKDPSLFESVLFCGTPFTPGISFLPDMHEGGNLGLTREVFWTLRSPWAFFPAPEHQQPSLDGQPVDFYNPNTWLKFHLGIFNDGHEPTERELAHLRAATSAARRYRTLLDAPPSREVAAAGAWPPVCVLVGAGGTVLETAVSTTRQAGGRLVIGWDTGGSGEGRSVPGDGRVRRASGVPPAEHGVPHRVVETNLAHMALVCENAAQVVGLANALSREANGRSLPRSHSAVPCVASPAPGFPHGQRIVKPLTIGDGQGRGWDRSGEASELARA